MARILLPTFGSFGDIHPFLALSLELQARGHFPIIATSERYRVKIEETGIAFHAIAPDLPPREEWGEYIPRLMDEKKGTQRLFAEILMPAVRQAYSDLLPVARECDLIVSHSIIHAAPLVAHTLDKKWLSVVLAPLSLWSVFDPPLPPNFPASEKLRKNLNYQRALKWAAKKVSFRWVREVSAFRKELGLPLGAHPLFEGAHSPFGTLALFSRELAALQPDWPARVSQTGFCFYDRKGDFFGDREYSSALVPAIQNFLEAGDAPIVFTLGSAAVFDARTFYQVAIEAARALKRRAILLIGDEANRPLNLSPDNKQIAAFEYAPYGEIFSRALAIVHQGGAGTTGQVLRAGAPSLVMPYSHDQPDHAARLARRGIARVLPRTQCTAGRLTRELEILLSDENYAARAKEIGARVQMENGVNAAVDAIEKALSGEY